MIKNFKSVGVLVVICSIVALLLACTNQITDPIIKENAKKAASKALSEVLPDGKIFDEVNISKYTLPASVQEVHKETSGKGHVIKLSVTGYGPDMVIMCGIDANNVVTGAKCLSSNETLGKEKEYGKNFAGKDAAAVEATDTIAGATMTTGAYKGAIKDALNAVLILGGAEVDLRTEEEKAVDQLKSDLEANEEVDLSQYELPASVTKAYKGSKGYVIYLTVSGYKPGMEIVCGVGTDNKIVNAVCLKSAETNGKQKDYGQQFIGKDVAGAEAVDTIAGSTMTTTGYKGAVKDALNAAVVLSGGSVDLRTPEQILADNLAAALPAGEGKFSKVFFTEVVEGVDAVYVADNGAGYVAVAVKEIIGEDFTGEFIGIDSDLNVVTAGSTVNTEAALNAVKTLKESTSKDITATLSGKLDTLIANTADKTLALTYRAIQSNVVSVNKTATGNYVFEIKGAGYGINGGDEYHPASGEYIVIRLSISADGKIIDCLTVSQKESENIGDFCAKEEFYSRFDGKTEADYKDVDGIAGATITTNGYMQAIERCFKAVDVLEGGAK